MGFLKAGRNNRIGKVLTLGEAIRIIKIWEDSKKKPYIKKILARKMFLADLDGELNGPDWEARIWSTYDNVFSCWRTSDSDLVDSDHPGTYAVVISDNSVSDRNLSDQFKFRELPGIEPKIDWREATARTLADEMLGEKGGWQNVYCKDLVVQACLDIVNQVDDETENPLPAGVTKIWSIGEI